MKHFFIIYILVIIATISVFGFRGGKSSREPIQIFTDMRQQAKFHPQGTNTLFQNGMDDRPRVQGTVARGTLLNQQEVFSPEFQDPTLGNPQLVHGKNEDGSFYAGFPLNASFELIELGRERYSIHCTVCHGAAGDGNGVTRDYGVAAASYHTDRLREMPNGEIYQTIVHGKGLMYGLGHNLDLEERWAIVLYLRALQRSQNGSINDVPAARRSELGF